MSIAWHDTKTGPRITLRRALLCFCLFILALAVLTVVVRLADDKAPPLSNGSTDGRFHTCGYVTEQGVTEHLAEYHARCGYDVTAYGCKPGQIVHFTGAEGPNRTYCSDS